MNTIGGRIFYADYGDDSPTRGRKHVDRTSANVTESQFAIVDYLMDRKTANLNKLCSDLKLSKKQVYDDIYILTNLCDIYEDDTGETVGILSGWFWDIGEDK